MLPTLRCAAVCVRASVTVLPDRRVPAAARVLQRDGVRCTLHTRTHALTHARTPTLQLRKKFYEVVEDVVIKNDDQGVGV